MRLHQLVEINKEVIVANAVSFSLMDDEEMNLRLCQGFIFNFDPDKPELSTVGILDALRRSYHSRNASNIHLVIQDYGKGKSHFAVVIANFFQKPFASREVQGVLRQVEVATSGKDMAITQTLQSYKQNQRHQHLVICLSGDRGGNFKNHLLAALVKGLEAKGIQESIAQSTCREPLRYLESLNAQDRAKAETYLKSIDYVDGDFNSLTRRLRENNPSVIPTVKNLAREITGFTPDFTADIDVEAILEEVLQSYCTGTSALFQGILILFDELNYYLQSWAVDQIGAGGTTLQNITNICEKFKGKVALLSFTQIHPSGAAGISANAIPSYEKIVSRLAPKDGTTYNPVSSLELVLDHLIIQKENQTPWQDFYRKYENTLQSEARIAFTKRIKIYREQGWDFEKFYRHLAKGCFPLHPLTAYLLCHLNFTQDRSAIQFIQGNVEHFIQNNPIEQAGKLNYIYPIILVDVFLENFSKESVYIYYKKAKDIVAGSDNPDELVALKALFLFDASGEKLTKPDSEEHLDVLINLTGLPRPRLQTALETLEKTRDLIYYRPETKLYCFWEGMTPSNLEEEIENRIRNQIASIEQVVKYCQPKIAEYVDDSTTKASQFIRENKLEADDWQFEHKVYSIHELLKALQITQIQQLTQQKGVLAYVLAETQEELRELRQQVAQHLAESPIKNQIAIAIPQEETGDLARLLLKIQTLKNLDTTEQRQFGIVAKPLLQRWQEQVNQRLSRLLKSCTYYCIVIEKLPLAQQKKPQQVISKLLQENYPFVPPVEGIEKMRSNHLTGKKIIRWVARQIFLESSFSEQTFPEQSFDTVIKQVFYQSWGLLQKRSNIYSVQEPINEKIRCAWDRISQITDLQQESHKVTELEEIWRVLSLPPYGYSVYNFIILLSAWLAFHRQEVSLRGVEVVTSKKGQKTPVKTQSLKEWGYTDILENPSEFVTSWIVRDKAKLIRRLKVEVPTLPSSPIDYDQAQQYLAEVETFLESVDADLEANELTQTRNHISAAVEKVNTWFQPFEQAESRVSNATLQELLQLYSRLYSWPAPRDRSNKITVQPTHQQQERASHILQTVSSQLIELVEAKSQQAETLMTLEECRNHQQEIQGVLAQIKQVQNLPPHLSETLSIALEKIERRQLHLREQEEVQEKLIADMQLLDAIRNCSSATKTSTILLCEQALQEIANLRQRLSAPTEHTSEIDQIITVISEKIVGYRQRLNSLQTRLERVNHLKELNPVRTQCAELDLVFQNSTDYQLYQALKEQIQFVADDLERLQHLETSCQQTDSISSCNAVWAMIIRERDNFQNSTRFQTQLLHLENETRRKIQSYIEELTEFEQSLADVSTAREAQRLQEDLLKKSSQYSHSREEERYNAITLELSLLIELLQLFELVNVNTLESCQAQLTRLQQWQHENQELTSRLQERLATFYQRLEELQQGCIQQWLQDLVAQNTYLNQLRDDEEKLTVASELLEQIKTEQSQYIHLLNSQQSELLTNIRNQCLAEQEKQTANQIIKLFLKLSQQERYNLYQKLAGYLEDEYE